jgi:hypothetical protein
MEKKDDEAAKTDFDDSGTFRDFTDTRLLTGRYGSG